MRSAVCAIAFVSLSIIASPAFAESKKSSPVPELPKAVETSTDTSSGKTADPISKTPLPKTLTTETQIPLPTTGPKDAAVGSDTKTLKTDTTIPVPPIVNTNVTNDGKKSSGATDNQGTSQTPLKVPTAVKSFPDQKNTTSTGVTSTKATVPKATIPKAPLPPAGKTGVTNEGAAEATSAKKVELNSAAPKVGLPKAPVPGIHQDNDAQTGEAVAGGHVVALDKVNDPKKLKEILAALRAIVEAQLLQNNVEMPPNGKPGAAADSSPPLINGTPDRSKSIGELTGRTDGAGTIVESISAEQRRDDPHTRKDSKVDLSELSKALEAVDGNAGQGGQTHSRSAIESGSGTTEIHVGDISISWGTGDRGGFEVKTGGSGGKEGSNPKSNESGGSRKVTTQQIKNPDGSVVVVFSRPDGSTRRSYFDANKKWTGTSEQTKDGEELPVHQDELYQDGRVDHVEIPHYLVEELLRQIKSGEFTDEKQMKWTNPNPDADPRSVNTNPHVDVLSGVVPPSPKQPDGDNIKPIGQNSGTAENQLTGKKKECPPEGCPDPNGPDPNPDARGQ